MLSNGYTYSYFHTEPKNGEKCCRSVKAKCEVNEDSEKICECWRGPNVCGKNCSQIVAKLEKLDEGHEKINEELEKLVLEVFSSAASVVVYRCSPGGKA